MIKVTIQEDVNEVVALLRKRSRSRGGVISRSRGNSNSSSSSSRNRNRVEKKGSSNNIENIMNEVHLKCYSVSSSIFPCWVPFGFLFGVLFSWLPFSDFGQNEEYVDKFINAVRDRNKNSLTFREVFVDNIRSNEHGSFNDTNDANINNCTTTTNPRNLETEEKTATAAAAKTPPPPSSPSWIFFVFFIVFPVSVIVYLCLGSPILQSVAGYVE